MSLRLYRSGFTRLLVCLLAVGQLTGCVVSNLACEKFRDPAHRDEIEPQLRSPEDRAQWNKMNENCVERDLGIIIVK